MFHVPTGARPDLSRLTCAQCQMGRTSSYLHFQVARTDLPLHVLIPLLYLKHESPLEMRRWIIPVCKDHNKGLSCKTFQVRARVRGSADGCLEGLQSNHSIPVPTTF